MGNKYIDLSKKPPKEAAKIVGEVEKRNYLAHSIREIENALSRPPYSKRYRIITHVPIAKNEDSITFFRVNCCEIFLPSQCEKMSDKRIRLALGHELGHLIFNLGNLENSSILEHKNPSNEEEIFAWKFAYYLIKLKSEQHENNKESRVFIYNDNELKDTVSGIVKEKNKEIYDDIVRSLNEW